MLLPRVQAYAEKHCLLDPNRPLLVGVSGGPDSLCLLHVLHRLGYWVLVAHFDHGLRPTSGQEARQVEALAAGMGIPCVSERQPVEAFAQERRMSLEEAARTLRYRFLFHQARRMAAQAVAVGHTANDQVETVLMHLLRGCGMQGLKGMRPRSYLVALEPEIPLVRPLLSTWRAEVLAYCRTHDLPTIEDRSNLDTTFLRNRLRHELIPQLETYNPQVRRKLWQMASLLADDLQVLETHLDAAWRDVVDEAGEGWVAFKGALFIAQPASVQRGLLRRAIAGLRPYLRDISFEVVEEARNLMAAPPRSGRAALAAGLVLLFEGPNVLLASVEAAIPSHAWPLMSDEAPMTLEVPGGVALAGGWCLVAEKVRRLGKAQLAGQPADHPFEVYLDGETLQLPLEVRTRRPGDRIQPLGMGGKSQKVADLMINVKLPQRARQRWPLVLSAGEIVWVPGYRLAHPFRMRTNTRWSVRLRVVPPSEGE